MLTDLDVRLGLRFLLQKRGLPLVKVNPISWNQENTVFRVCFRVSEHRRNLEIYLGRPETGSFLLPDGERVFWANISLGLMNVKGKTTLYWRLIKD